MAAAPLVDGNAMMPPQYPVRARPLRAVVWGGVPFVGVTVIDLVSLLLPVAGGLLVTVVTGLVVWLALLSCLVLAHGRPLVRSVGVGLAVSVPVTSIVIVVNLFW